MIHPITARLMELPVEMREFDLVVGETIYLGEYELTVQDIDGDRLLIRIESGTDGSRRETESSDLAAF